MQLKIDRKIFDEYPDYKLGVILVKGMDNSKRNSVLESLLRGVGAQRAKEFSKKNLGEEGRIKVWNQAYGKFGINPNKFPPSVISLVNKASEGEEIEHINILMDLANYYSLRNLLPTSALDIDWLCGQLKLTYTKGKEAFRPAESIDVKEAKEGEVAYMDRGGIVRRYWNHLDCERTKVTKKTLNAAVLVEDLSRVHMDEFGAILDEIAEGIVKYLGAKVEKYVLNEDNNSVDLGVDGRHSADDFKITAQEKAFFKAKSAKKKPKKSPVQSPLIQEETPVLKLENDNLLKEKLRKDVEKAVIVSYPKITKPEAKIEYPAVKKHGDYACNIAMQLAKELKSNPAEISKKIIKNLPDKDYKADFAMPGFINFRLDEQLLKQELKKVLTQREDYGKIGVGKEKTIVMDYSSPNIAKPLGIHHLLSTVIGQSIYNIFEFLGFKTVAINHIGDWGTQFGKLIYAYKKWGDKEKIEKAPIKELLKLYVKFHDKAEKDSKIEEQGRKEFKKFEEGNKENRRLWKWFVKESLGEIENTYAKLGGIKFDHIQGESFYEDKLEDVFLEGKRRGIFEIGEEGAFIVKFDDPDIAPLVVKKKDGATLYSTRDFATLKYRINNWHPVRILYVVDVAQSLYFKQLFLGAARFPWYHGEGVHISFGRMHMKDGKMSTRKGNVVLLDDVLDEAAKRSLKIIKEKNADLKGKKEVSQKVGAGALKYSILAQNRNTDIVFDWDKMLSLDGNSAPYLQYTYARAKSILRRNDEDLGQKKDPSNVDEKIHDLLALFPKFAEKVALAGQEYKPNIISGYLYDLAQEFNSFYNTVPVLRCSHLKKRDFRLRIVEATAEILKNGLKLLSIEVVEEM